MAVRQALHPDFDAGTLPHFASLVSSSDRISFMSHLLDFVAAVIWTIKAILFLLTGQWL